MGHTRKAQTIFILVEEPEGNRAPEDYSVPGRTILKCISMER
jgi:hypothetical protein